MKDYSNVVDELISFKEIIRLLKRAFCNMIFLFPPVCSSFFLALTIIQNVKIKVIETCFNRTSNSKFFLRNQCCKTTTL